MSETCPVCGTPVRIVGSIDDLGGNLGTMHYEPASDLPQLERALVESDILVEMIRRELPEESRTKQPSRFLRLNDAEVQHHTARARVIAERAKARTE